ncbi:MAG: hypothetical protein MZW92_48800 [Comamonadaceae bacterium]|nr:hypothetical protein [Comamonadaceae bacterium]
MMPFPQAAHAGRLPARAGRQPRQRAAPARRGAFASWLAEQFQQVPQLAD